MHNYIGYEMARSIGRYASRCQFIELQVNDEYLGVYVFMEKLKRDNQRINIKSLNASSANITGGYILTIDKVSVGDEGIGKPLSYLIIIGMMMHATLLPTASEVGIVFSGMNWVFRLIAPYHSQQYLETYFLYEYPKLRISLQHKKNTSPITSMILKQHYWQMISLPMYAPTQASSTFPVLWITSLSMSSVGILMPTG